MALSVNEMRSISVAFYESLPPSVEEIVESILMAAQAAAILPIQVVGSFLRENTA